MATRVEEGRGGKVGEERWGRMEERTEERMKEGGGRRKKERKEVEGMNGIRGVSGDALLVVYI